MRWGIIVAACGVALGEHPGLEAGIEIPGTRPDIPGLYRDDLHPTCYAQDIDGFTAD